MSRPVRLVLACFSLAVMPALGCVEQTPAKSPEQRVADAEEKIYEMEKYSQGEITYAEYRDAVRELNDARRDLEEQESNVAAGREASEEASQTSYPPTYPMTYERTY